MQSIKIDFGKPFNQWITIDTNYVNVIDCIHQSLKSILTTLLVISVINVIDFIAGCRSYMSLISGIDFVFKRLVIAVK